MTIKQHYQDFYHRLRRDGFSEIPARNSSTRPAFDAAVKSHLDRHDQFAGWKNIRRLSAWLDVKQKDWDRLEGR